MVAPVPTRLFFTYSTFALAMVGLFAFAGYVVERTARENFVVSAQLRDSLARVKQLDELLPICASCKSIRDDQG